MSEDDLKNLKELESKNKPRILTIYFEDGGEISAVPYDDYEDLQQENQQLKEQLLEQTRDNYKLKDELNKKTKEYQETYNDVRIEIKDYKNQLKQRDEVIDEAIKKVNKWDSSNTSAIDDYYFKEDILQIIDKALGGSDETNN